jgi:hypothetical protein
VGKVTVTPLQSYHRWANPVRSVPLVRLVRLQMDNSLIFLHQQTDKRPSSVLHENGTNGKRQLPFFAVNGKRKWKTFVCLLQMETENRSLVSLVGQR